MDRSNVQTVVNTFLCCFKLRSGSLIVSCANIVISALGIWHSLYFARQCSILGYHDVTTVHYFWIAISILCTLFNVYLMLCLFKESCTAIAVWIIWNGIVLILRFTIIILILALNDNNWAISQGVIFHILTMLTTIYSIVVLLSYNQQITLNKFGYYQRYRYPKPKFLVRKTKDYTGLEDEYVGDDVENHIVDNMEDNVGDNIDDDTEDHMEEVFV